MGEKIAFINGLIVSPRGSARPLLDRLSFTNWYSSSPKTPSVSGESSGMVSPSPASPGGDPLVARSPTSSVIDAIRNCGLAGLRIDKEDLRTRILLPPNLRKAVRDCIRSRDVTVADASASAASDNDDDGDDPGGAPSAAVPECPIVVFINSRSGGRHGPELMTRLHELICQEQVFDLQNVRPHEFIEYGLGCLERLGDLGDVCAKESRKRLRIVVAGGDGTVGWMLGSLTKLNIQNRMPVPPTAIIPLGTGNDLSRNFGWGGSFPFAWKSAIKKTLHKASTGPIRRLDSWELLISMPAGDYVDPPHSLKQIKKQAIDQGLEIEGELSEKVTCYEGVFYNYFSIGMDAQVAYGFHHLRNEKPYLAQGPISNKLIYTGYTCSQGWFLTPCMTGPGLSGLRNILRIHVRKIDSSEWGQIEVPSSVRAIVILNLHSYASGRHPWGNLKPEYLEKRGFVEANVDDGLLEIFGLKQGWHASFVMVELIAAKHIAQAAAIRLEIRGGEWRNAYMQMDGEPWKQEMNRDYSTFVEIKRVPHHSLMVSGE